MKLQSTQLAKSLISQYMHSSHVITGVKVAVSKHRGGFFRSDQEIKTIRNIIDPRDLSRLDIATC